ncbi:hypothetical protein B8V81_2367 [Paenibacillus pasadenensis]|uniref:OmpA-like domain-containing protein n=1 Tax=Paenibacillus pasadenensis TaxID=217090 RepID=A0A2N5N0T5_9BACL|nr:hypothetical protein B8V81_2367 [Paenibacillus pasadenensis]
MYDNQSSYEQQTAELSKQEAAIEEKNQLIEEIVGVKSKIIQELLQAFQDSDLNLEVDKQTGAIRFSGGVFFDRKSSAVSESGRQYLEQFIPKYNAILLSDRFRDQISQIIVEGHTDTDGGYLYNLQLSQDRALSVVQQVFAPDFPTFKYQDSLKNVITANGRSFSVPIRNEDGSINLDKSRRVEFKFRLKDEQLLDRLQGLMDPHG